MPTRSSRSSSNRWIRCSRFAITFRTWLSNSLRLTCGTVSNSKLNVYGQMRTGMPLSNVTVSPTPTSVSPIMQIFSPTLSSSKCEPLRRTMACFRETRGLSSTSMFEGSRPMVTSISTGSPLASLSSTSKMERRLSLILLNQIFTMRFSEER